MGKSRQSVSCSEDFKADVANKKANFIGYNNVAHLKLSSLHGKTCLAEWKEWGHNSIDWF